MCARQPRYLHPLIKATMFLGNKAFAVIFALVCRSDGSVNLPPNPIQAGISILKTIFLKWGARWRRLQEQRGTFEDTVERYAAVLASSTSCSARRVTQLRSR